jgi:hypothetical protein
MTQVFQLREDKALPGFPISYRGAMGLVPAKAFRTGRSFS